MLQRLVGGHSGPVLIGCGNLVTTDARYLLVRESKSSAGFRYNLPSGTPEVGETLAAAAIREAREETGLEVAPRYLVGLYQCPETSEGFGVVNFVFFSEVIGGSLRPSPEHPEVRYFSADEIDRLGEAGQLRGTHIRRCIEDLRRGANLPLDLVHLVPPSPLP